MAVQQELGNERTRVFVEGLDVVFERVFDAPLDLVWKVYTDPERIARAIDSLSRVGFNDGAAVANARRFSRQRFREDFHREAQNLTE